MDHLKSVEGRLAFHRTEIERLEIARKVILEIDRSAENRTAAKPAKRKVVKRDQPKTRTSLKSAKGNLATVPSRATAKDRIIDLLASERNLTSGTIMDKIGLAGSPEAKQRVYTALYDLKKKGRVTVDGQHQYNLAVAA